MEELRLGVIESQFAEIIWSNEPLPSGELVKLCEQKLRLEKVDHLHGFKEVVRAGNLSERKRNGFRPDDERGIRRCQSEKFVEDNFGGSLPAFLAAFTTRKKLNKSEVDEIKKMIDAIGKEG